jgi:hypothetical protein
VSNVAGAKYRRVVKMASMAADHMPRFGSSSGYSGIGNNPATNKKRYYSTVKCNRDPVSVSNTYDKTYE